jgi:hypothetical protein
MVLPCSRIVSSLCFAARLVGLRWEGQAVLGGIVPEGRVKRVGVAAIRAQTGGPHQLGRTA